MIGLFIFIFGLLIGSFLNVIVFRLDQKKTFIFGRSACPNCKKEITWQDNIPLVSFLILGGKCRHCKKNISLQYPIVELTTAIVFLLFYFYLGLSLQFFIYLVFSSFLIIIFVYDLKHYLILDRVTIPAMIFAFLANLYLKVPLTSLILGAIVGAGFFALQFFLSKGKWVGDGDIRLGALMGLILGLKLTLVALFLSYILGASIGLILIFTNKKKMSSQVPFGPFLVAGTFIALLYGQKLLDWYLNLIYFY